MTWSWTGLKNRLIGKRENETDSGRGLVVTTRDEVETEPDYHSHDEYGTNQHDEEPRMPSDPTPEPSPFHAEEKATAPAAQATATPQVTTTSTQSKSSTSK